MAIAAPALPDGLVLLDGGFGQELIHRGVASPDGLWSAHALFAEPEAVVAIHRDYIAAGARVITTNSYSLVRWRVEAAGHGDRFEALVRTAGELACRARDEMKADVLIAGALPPLYGSYRPDLVRPFAELMPQYAELAGLLAPYADLLLCETMSTAGEAASAAAGAATAGKPLWVSWTLKDDGGDRLRSGESIEDAIAALGEDLPVSAHLLNCCAPESISAGMSRLAAASPLPVGGYANGFTHIPDRWKYEHPGSLPDARPDLEPEAYLRFARQWVADGARIVGGCCEVGPAHIAALRDALL